MEKMDLKLVNKNLDLKNREFILSKFIDKFPKTKLHTVTQLNKFCKNKIIINDNEQENIFNNKKEQKEQKEQTTYLFNYLEILN